jgi:hypothetical protein
VQGTGYGVRSMVYGAWGTEYGVWGTGYGVWCMGYGVRGTGYGVRGTGYGVWCMVYGVRGTGYGVRGTGYWVRGTGYWVLGMVYGVWCMVYWDTGYGVRGMGVWGLSLQGEGRRVFTRAALIRHTAASVGGSLFTTCTSSMRTSGMSTSSVCRQPRVAVSSAGSGSYPPGASHSAAATAGAGIPLATAATADASTTSAALMHGNDALRPHPALLRQDLRHPTVLQQVLPELCGRKLVQEVL